MTLNVNNIFYSNADTLQDEFFYGNSIGPTSLVVKGSDESVTSSTVMQDDDELKFTINPNSSYEFNLMLSTYNNGGDFKFQINLPAGCTGGFIYNGETDSTIRYELRSGVLNTPCEIASFNGGRGHNITGSFTTGATPGDFQLQWAQRSSSGNATIVYAGSYLKIMQLASN